MRAALLVLLTAVLLCPTSATADPATLARAEAIASAQWPDSPCHGIEHVEFVTLPADVEGQALSGTCNVQVSNGVDATPGLDAVRLCIVLAHEFGHLARDDDWHSPDPNNIMYYKGPSDYPPCDALMPPPPTPRAFAAQLLGLGPGACRLARATVRHRIYRCGRARHVAVLVDRHGLPTTAMEL